MGRLPVFLILTLIKCCATFHSVRTKFVQFRVIFRHIFFNVFLSLIDPCQIDFCRFFSSPVFDRDTLDALDRLPPSIK